MLFISYIMETNNLFLSGQIAILSKRCQQICCMLSPRQWVVQGHHIAKETRESWAMKNFTFVPSFQLACLLYSRSDRLCAIENWATGVLEARAVELICNYNRREQIQKERKHIPLHILATQKEACRFLSREKHYKRE